MMTMIVCVCVRMSPLHVAVLHDNVELTSLLLQHGALVDNADKKGRTLVINLSHDPAAAAAAATTADVAHLRAPCLSVGYSPLHIFSP